MEFGFFAHRQLAVRNVLPVRESRVLLRLQCFGSVFMPDMLDFYIQLKAYSELWRWEKPY